MLAHLEMFITFELQELAVQAKISQIEYLTRQELIDELENDYWTCLYDAVIEHNERFGIDLTDMYFISENERDCYDNRY